MLFLLTGDIQIGKTRWLEALVAGLQGAGVRCAGVIAPGRWRERACADGGVTFEKLGIDNVLLPQGERICFGARRDLAQAQGIEDVGSQSAQAGLGWEISDAAIAQVNRHFASLTGLQGADLLVIDELGRLELLRGEGLVEAVGVLAAGPQGACQNALVVVRETLVERAEERFGSVWGGSMRISPGDAGRRLVEKALGLE